ncbi:hypothetical protein MMC13_008404 [Lambiella insularis]|nr:hypothetical protein [Lambiella insularis]
MTSTTSVLMMNPLQQHPVIASPTLAPMPDSNVPPVPHRRDGYQRDRTLPWMNDTLLLRNGTPVPPQAQVKRAEAQMPYSQPLPSPTWSKPQDSTAPAQSRLDDSSDQKSSRDGSTSSNGDSYDTSATSHTSLPIASSAMRFDKGKTFDALAEDFNLDASYEDEHQTEVLEKISDLLFSPLHLTAIFKDPSCLLKFTSFLSAFRPQSIPTLIYYLDATKALKAIKYANAVATALEPSQDLPLISIKTSNSELEDRAKKAFDLLAERDLPAYIAHVYIQVVKSSMMKPVSQGPQSTEAPEGFAEVFCLTDPSRPDNPIVFASEAFHQMTQYSMNYIIGRNCRFLQGPKTNPASLERIRQTVSQNEEHCEVILNYRRDGSPFLNLLMHAPLYDRSGKLRYFMGAQIDVSNVIDESPELETLQRVMVQASGSTGAGVKDIEDGKNEFQQFIETLDMEELRAVRAWEDRMLQELLHEDHAPTSKKPRRPGLPRNHHSEILKNGVPVEPSPGTSMSMYQNFMLVRPYPSLRILFTSPSLNLPGMIQAPIMDKLGGSIRVRNELTQALEDGREVTAKIRWKTNENEESQDRWIFFTPLIGRKGEIGVWMAILEDDIPEAVEMVQHSRLAKPNFTSTSPIPEEVDSGKPTNHDTVVPVHHTHQIPGYRQHLARNESTTSAVSLGRRSPSLDFDQRSKAPSISGTTIDTLLSDGNGDYLSLEERLRRKRERDTSMMLEHPGMPLRKTYKSFSPDTFVNSD